eukprot:1341856-Amorphochlora_amoeboformis.AAC.1
MSSKTFMFIKVDIHPVNPYLRGFCMIPIPPQNRVSAVFSSKCSRQFPENSVLSFPHRESLRLREHSPPLFSSISSAFWIFPPAVSSLRYLRISTGIRRRSGVCTTVFRSRGVAFSSVEGGGDGDWEESIREKEVKGQREMETER